MRLAGVCLDCADAEALAAFYVALLGYEEAARDDDGSWVLLHDPAGGPSISCQAEPWYEPPVWPEQPGRPSKMLHLELLVDDVASAVERAVAAGATVAPHQPADRDPAELRVLLDPAGHPFCLAIA